MYRSVSQRRVGPSHMLEQRPIWAVVILGILAGLLSTSAPPLRASPTLDSHFRLLKAKTDLTAVPPRSYTLIETWDAAMQYGQHWSRDARIISINSVDVDDPVALSANPSSDIGIDGRRSSWQSVLTSPSVNRQLFLQITNGVVVEAIEDGIHDPTIPATGTAPSIDTSEISLLLRAVYSRLQGSNGRAKGYHYVFEAGSNGIAAPTIRALASLDHKGQSHPILVSFDAQTGNIAGAQIYRSMEGKQEWTTDFQER